MMTYSRSIISHTRTFVSLVQIRLMTLVCKWANKHQPAVSSCHGRGSDDQIENTIQKYKDVLHTNEEKNEKNP